MNSKFSKIFSTTEYAKSLKKLQPIKKPDISIDLRNLPRQNFIGQKRGLLQEKEDVR